jgi:hypothetical protein
LDKINSPKEEEDGKELTGGGWERREDEMSDGGEGCGD